MNVGAIDSTIRFLCGVLLLIVTLFFFTGAITWITTTTWALSLYLLGSSLFNNCLCYKLLGFKTNEQKQ